MGVERIDAIGYDTKANRGNFETQVKKKNPWDHIGAVMTGVGSLVNNLPSNFNSAFTVAQGSNVQGAFGD